MLAIERGELEAATKDWNLPGTGFLDNAQSSISLGSYTSERITFQEADGFHLAFIR